MSAAKHTPGPWAVHDTHPEKACFYIGSPGNVYDVATVYRARDEATQAADAALIAAAPKMAEALAYVEQNTDHEPGGCGEVDRPGDAGMVLCINCVARNALRAAGRLP